MNEQPAGLLLALESSLHAPPERVFNLLTEPEALVKWFGPHGFRIPAAKLDLRVGGAYRLSMQPPEGESFHLAGEFLAVDPPKRLVYTFRYEEPAPDDRETTVTLALDALGDETRVSLTQGMFATEERRALHRLGWADSFAKLRQLIESGPRES